VPSDHVPEITWFLVRSVIRIGTLCRFNQIRFPLVGDIDELTGCSKLEPYFAVIYLFDSAVYVLLHYVQRILRHIRSNILCW